MDRLLPHDARVHQLVQQQRPQVAHQGDPGIGTRDRPIWQARKIGRWTAGPLYAGDYWQRRLQRYFFFLSSNRHCRLWIFVI